MSTYQFPPLFTFQRTSILKNIVASRARHLSRSGVVVLAILLIGCSFASISEAEEELSQRSERRGSLKQALTSSSTENHRQSKSSIYNQPYQSQPEPSRSSRNNAAMTSTDSSRHNKKKRNFIFREIDVYQEDDRRRQSTDNKKVKINTRNIQFLHYGNSSGEDATENWIDFDEAGNIITSVIIDTIFDITGDSDDDQVDEDTSMDSDSISTSESETLLPINEEHKPHFGVNAAYMPVRNGTVDVIREVGLYIENGTETESFGAVFTHFTYTLTTGSLLEQAVTDSSGNGFYFYYKKYLNNRTVFSSPYIIGGLGLGTLDWHYRRAIIDSDGYAIDSDSVGFTDFRIGVGGELGRPSNISLTLSATAIWRIYDATTQQGFDNDILTDYYIPAFGSSLSMKF